MKITESPFTSPDMFVTPRPALGFLLVIITGDAGSWEGGQVAQPRSKAWAVAWIL